MLFAVAVVLVILGVTEFSCQSNAASPGFLWRKPCDKIWLSPICIRRQRCVMELPLCGPVPCPAARRRCILPEEKPGKCPVAPPGIVTTCQVKCRADFLCPGHQKCCQFGCTRQCMEPAPRVKAGKCPVTPPGIVTTCKRHCSSDAVCPGKQRCCQLGCAVQCMTPAVPVVKSGKCPAESPANRTVCGVRCSSDDVCPGDQKCCRLGCAVQCLAPEGMKGGTCPKRPLQIGLCYSFCKTDSDCPDERKCCGECFRYCSKPSPPLAMGVKACPLTPPNFPRPEDCASQCPKSGCPDGQQCCGICGGRCSVPVSYKPGACPPIKKTFTKSACPSGALNECLDDGSCLDDEKCCSNGCRLTCNPPHF